MEMNSKFIEVPDGSSGVYVNVSYELSRNVTHKEAKALTLFLY